MAVTTEVPTRHPARRPDLKTRLSRLVARPGFQRWASRFPLTRGIVRREGQALFDLVQGFVSSQVLFAVVELGLLHRLMDGPCTVAELSANTGVAPDRMQRLLQAAAALQLIRREGAGFAIARKGAALVGVPGLEQMIAHHDVLYRDLRDPVAFLKGEVETELADFWPYVFGAGGAADPQTVARYSDLMAQSQAMVAQDTLDAVSLKGVRHLVDIGGGSGAFAQAAARAAPGLQVTLFDLPNVIASARQRLSPDTQIALRDGSFRDDPLPIDADAMSLIRVLYDHQDDTVTALLRKVYAALPKGGRLVISEPMSGGTRPDPAGDVYFAFYCMAMRTGTVRSQTRIAELLRDAGFGSITQHRARRSYVTSVVSARKPSA